MAKTKAKGAAKPAKSKPAAKSKSAKQATVTADGPTEVAAWVTARGLSTTGNVRWNVTIALDVIDQPAAEVYSGTTGSRFHLAIYRDEWGFLFVHKGKASHICRAATTFVNGSDQHKLVKEMPAIADLGSFVRALEAKHGLAFKREHASIRSNLAGAKAAVRDWLRAL